MIAPSRKLDYDDWKDIATLLYRVLYDVALSDKKDMMMPTVAALCIYEDKLKKESE